MTCFPIYFLHLDEWEIFYPADKRDIGHPKYFEEEIAPILAKYHGIDVKEIKDLCYSQVRARYSTSPQPMRLPKRQMLEYKKRGIRVPNGAVIYMGEALKEVVALIDKHFPGMEIKYDDHHRRQESDVLKFETIVQDRQLHSH